ncbi:MAG: asparagine synthase (glutamine-hydrolyzing) [Bacteroidetes bacterium]|nr:asparagine synthase (glutamine-hydrolyzing) [Bacteroidota bacterium]
MCGIAGIIAFSQKSNSSLDKIEDAVRTLNKRGPDAKGIYKHNSIAFCQTRLAIIDTSDAGLQPMHDESGRYTIIFNGEFFNFKEHRQFVLDKGYKLKSESDTEVLLYLYIIEGEKCLKRVNGFFALAIYDKQEQTVFIARDRMGVKPLLIYKDDEKLMFASEMKSLIAMGIPKEIDEISLFTYLQLNYIPAPQSIFKNVSKLLPGTYLKFFASSGKFTIQDSKYDADEESPELTEKYYEIKQSSIELSYADQQKKLFDLMESSVQRRLISDVPLGSFLSGGIDSSVIAALASRHTNHLKTFSIGFKDEPLFDETRYANLVAKKIGSDHTVFSLTTDDLFANLHAALDYIDEPFADSSALNVHILSQHTRRHVTVALSGDGADEMFGGYNKHAAELKIREGGMAGSLVGMLQPVWNMLPQSRNSKAGNKIRQLSKFSQGLKQSKKERYWSWAGYSSPLDCEALLKKKTLTSFDRIVEYSGRKDEILRLIHEDGDMNEVLLADMNLVLPNDMLMKVDLMSMANSLEVRTPFLDYTVVDFAFSLPEESKLDAHGRKKIVRDAFRNLLPEELYSRSKQGFEVPLLKWFSTELKSMITDDLLSEKFISSQNIFDYPEIKKLLDQLYSNSPGDSVARVWGLIVFQYWWRSNMQK